MSFTTVNQIFGGPSWLSTPAEHCFVVWTVLNDLITARSTVVGSWEESSNTWLTVAKNAFVCWAFNVRNLLKGAISFENCTKLQWMVKVCIQAKWPIRSALIPVNKNSVKRLGVFILPLRGMLVHAGLPTRVNITGSHLYNWMERGAVNLILILVSF